MSIPSYILVFITMISLGSLVAQPKVSDDMHVHLYYLAADSLHGRAPGGTDEQKAAKYIAQYLHQYSRAKISRQYVLFRIDSASAIDTAINVIGYVNNHAKQTIILCAHYDHLGYGSGRSRELIKKNVIHPGADDNASGVALMLELAKWTCKHQHSYNYIYLASSAHELGLYGARYFVRSGFVSPNSVAAVFNFDMVGRLNTNYPTLKVSTTDSSAGRQAILESQKDSLHLRFDNDIENDFTAFKEGGFKTYSFTTGTHDDYHRSGDRPERINYTGLETIARFMKRVLLHWQ